MKMQEYVKKIFQNNIEVLAYSDKAISYFKRQNYHLALIFATRTIDAIQSIVEDIIACQTYFNEHSSIVIPQYIIEMLENLLSTLENKDYIFFTDLLELQFNPFIISLQEEVIRKEGITFNTFLYEDNMKLLEQKDERLVKALKNSMTPSHLMDKGYSMEYTSCGLMTMALFDGQQKYYMHGNGQIMKDAQMIAEEWFHADKFEYIIYGLGLGYHVIELLSLDETLTIKVFESDINVIQMAMAFTDMKLLLTSDRVRIIYDPKFEEYSYIMKNIGENIVSVIHYPSIRNINNLQIREWLEDYFIQYSSVANQLHSLNGNFRRNISHYDDTVDNLRTCFMGKDLYIIAAGPSLDCNYMELKKLKENSIILATGTVFRKLMAKGIKPNYVIITDSGITAANQMSGLETSDIPIIILSTANYRIGETYQGKRYLVCQVGYGKAEQLAREKGYALYQTGGSVSTTALDIGISLGCRRIIFLGLDLAFTGDYDHASDTALRKAVYSNDLRQVPDIYGNKVYTSNNLDIYRKWIEKRISKVTDIEFIDATEGGARIKGMKIATLSETIAGN